MLHGRQQFLYRQSFGELRLKSFLQSQRFVSSLELSEHQCAGEAGVGGCSISIQAENVQRVAILFSGINFSNGILCDAEWELPLTCDAASHILH